MPWNLDSEDSKRILHYKIISLKNFKVSQKPTINMTVTAPKNQKKRHFIIYARIILQGVWK